MLYITLNLNNTFFCFVKKREKKKNTFFEKHKKFDLKNKKIKEKVNLKIYINSIYN